MLIAQDPFFISRRERLVRLMAHYKLPAIYFQRNFTEIGGLISYGANFADGYRQAGVDVGKILQGASPADLPVVQSAKFELVINMKTRRRSASPCHSCCSAAPTKLSNETAGMLRFLRCGN